MDRSKETIHDPDHAIQIRKGSFSVDNAVSEIEQLATSLIQTVEFTEDLQESFQHLATNLSDLESERLDLHDQLEVQTINASIKRHALRNLPTEYQKQLEEAVLAARNGNKSTIESLQSQMNSATEETRATLMRQQVLQKENAKYLPERELVTRHHDELIAALNQRMADKASRQIKLNETKDQFRETKSHLTEFDLGMKNLQDDMAAFYKEASAEQDQLETEILKTQDAIKVQNEKNAEVKQTADDIQEKIVVVNARLDIVLKDVRRTENSKARLEMQSIQLAETINREKILNQEKSEEVVGLEAVRDRQNLGYQEKVKALEEKISKVDLEYRQVEEVHQQLSKEKDEVFLKKEEAHRKKSKAHASVRELGREVQVVKQRTTSQIEKSARISQENNQFAEDKEKLDDNHRATVETFNQQITDYQTNLEVESGEKKKAQDEQENAEKTLDEFRAEQIYFMNDMTKKIEERRREHKLLAQQSSEYTTGVAGNVKRLGQLRVELDVSEKGFDIMKKEIIMEIERLKMSIEMCEAENGKKERYLEEKRPVVTDLEKELESVNEEYGRLKNEVVAVRNRQKSVQEQILRAQGMLDKLEKPSQKLKDDLKACHVNQLYQLTRCAQELKREDTEIYECTRRLESVEDENIRFTESRKEKDEDISDLLKDIKAHGAYQGTLLRNLKQLQISFMNAWNVCVAMEVESAQSDAKLLDDIKILQEETRDRCDVLSGISQNLMSEMDNLTGFLDNVNSRRPQDTRQDRRGSIRPTPPSSKPSLLAKQRRNSVFKPQSRQSLTLTPVTPSKQTISAR